MLVATLGVGFSGGFGMGVHLRLCGFVLWVWRLCGLTSLVGGLMSACGLLAVVV